ncbi:MAG: hypothetical protein ACFFBD_15990, partial [Candidatus Hodarchaeota archaeon]
QLETKGFYDYRSIQILQHLKITRDAATKIENNWTRNFSLMATELLAAPILENRFRPGGQYYVKGGKMLNALLPKDEKRAYHRGHKLIKKLYRFIPQCNHSMLKQRLNQLTEREPEI